MTKDEVKKAEQHLLRLINFDLVSKGKNLIEKVFALAAKEQVKLKVKKKCAIALGCNL